MVLFVCHRVGQGSCLFDTGGDNGPVCLSQGGTGVLFV